MLDIPDPASAPYMYCSAAGMGLAGAEGCTQDYLLCWLAGEHASDAYVDGNQVVVEGFLRGSLQMLGK